MMKTSWAVQVAFCSLAVTVLAVETKIAVQRGRTADLSAAIASNTPRHCSRIRYVEEPGPSCGSVQPSQFDCRYNGSVLYQHYGCRSTYEVASFQLSVLPNNFTVSDMNENVEVNFFSVEIVVEDSQSLLSNLTLHTSSFNDGVLLRVEFLQEMVGRCHYQLVTSDHLLPLPLAGELRGSFPRTLPCGYASREPLHYVPDSESRAPRDYVLFRVSDWEEEVYVVLEVWRSGSPLLPHVPVEALVVQGSTYTPIPDGLFPFQDRELRYRYTVSSHPGGQFVLLVSSNENVSYTVFTNADLRAGLVSYHRNESLTSTTTTVHYSVADLAGAALVQGEISVRSILGSWSLSQRTNRGLTLARGGTAAIDPARLDFYMLGACVDHSTVTLVQPPRHGDFTFLNGLSITNTTVAVSALRNGTVVYTHSGDAALADSSVWEFFCPLGLELVLSFGIKIAPLGNTPPQWSPGHALTTHQNLAVPVSHLPLSDPDSSHEDIVIHVAEDPAGSLVRVEDSDSMYAARTPFPPFLDAGRVNASAVSQFTLADVDNRNIWYLPPENASVDTLHLTAWDSVLPPHEMSDVRVPVAVAAGPLESSVLLSTREVFPPLLRNAPLPLHSHLPVYLTPRTLYSRVAGIPTSSIVYVVQAGPTRGLLCLSTPASCTSSLTQFTQSDINRKRVIYQPAENTVRPDKFEFVLTLHGVFHYNQSPYHFLISPVDKPRDFSSGKQFWINAGDEKPVALKYLRPYSNLLGKRTQFRVSSHPRHGVLLLNTTSHPANFSFDDLLRRRLSYRHSDRHDSHCSDSVSFTASNVTHSLQGTLQIAVARNPGKLLHAESGSQQLLGHTNFVFRPSQLPVNSPFCAQFVHYTILTPPNRGVLQLYSTEYNTVVQLRENSTFTAQDVQVGLLHYSLASPALVTRNISDIFYFEVSDPKNTKPILSRTSHSPNFQILIVPSPNVVHRISININSPKPLTWLLDHSAYGYVFGPSDISIESMTVLPSEIVIVIERQPIFGTILRNGTQVSSFSLEEVNAGWVRYETTLNRFDRISQDTFRLSIIVNLRNISYTQYVVQRHNFTVEWCSIAIQQPSYTVAEREGGIQVVLRREGSMLFQSNVTLSTVPLTASPCTSPLFTDGDYCPPPQEVTFEPGERVVTVHIPITDDQVAEDTKNFTLALSSPVSAVLRAGHATATIWITDFDDYATIGFVGPPALTDHNTCQVEVRVVEGVGSVALNLTRTGNLQESVGVICYTKSGTASRGQDFHPRPNNAPSRIEFQPNETTAQCRIEIVDDTLHEITERFLVFLGTVQGRASVNSSTSPLCVYLHVDSNDMPEVSFNTSELTVQESKVSEVLVHFKIVRGGFDLSSGTTVFYTSIIRPHDRATLHEDFDLFARGECGEGVACVDFAEGQTEVELSVRIMPDNLQEGNESFHLLISDATNGGRGRYELLKITILDATEPTIVEFSDPVYWLPEWRQLTRVAITRRGFISSVTDVTCIRKPGNATSESEMTIHNHADFVAGSGPSLVTFSENQTRAWCSIYLRDDNVYEGPEDLMVRLNTNSTWVILTRARARVIITDEEDAPLVRFSPAHYTVTEPRSNFPPDRTSVILHLNRSGDTSHASIIRYSTMEDTALAGADFVMNASRLTFLPGENTSQLTVQVLANHGRDADSAFLVVLMASDPNTTISQEGGRARVEVRNQPATVHFPDLPVVVSLLEDGSYEGSVDPNPPLDPNSPLACITSCDEEYLAITGKQYRQECLEQQIDSALTGYTWELSRDGSQFQQVTQTTAFTDTQVKVLEPVYLAPGLFVLCSTQAVDTYGTKGYSRTSLPSNLSQLVGECKERSWEATMFSYPGFSGAAEDLVRLTVTLPATPNYLPLLSTRPFTTHPLSLLTHAPSRVQHLCSNLPSPTLTTPSLLHLPSPLPRGVRQEKSLRLYLHLDSSSCLWHFHTWLPVHRLQAECGAVFTSSQVSVTVYAVHVHIQVNGTLVTSEPNATTAVLPFTPPPTPPVTTFDIFPVDTNHTNAFVFPVSVSTSGGTVEVYFYSVIQFPGHFLPPSPNTSLLYTSTSGETQAWLARLDYSLDLSLHLHCAPDGQQSQGCAPNELYTFPLHLLHPSLVPTITTHTTLLHSINSTAEATRPFQYDEMVYVLVVVDPSYRLRANHSLTVFRVILCHSATRPVSCTDQPSAPTVLDGRGGGGAVLQLRSPNRTAFQFRPTTALLPEYSNSSWYIHIIHGLQSDRAHTLHTVLSLPLYVPQPTSTPTLPGRAALPPGSVYLYAAIAILATAILLVGVTCVVFTLMLWGWRAKQKKLFLRRGERDSKKEPLNSESSETSKCDPPRTLQRTHSTIGFPTVERHKRDTQCRRPPTSDSLRPSSTAHRTPRSKSLPNLAFHTMCTDGPQQRRHQHKPQTKVKMLNTEHSSLNSWSHTLQARAQGDLGTAAVRVINELAAEKKSYGVNDLGGWQREGRGHVGRKTSALAYYAVHSLAASASTPEPGSLPATKL